MGMTRKGRIDYLQTEIIEAIKRACANDTLSKGGVEEIFGDLLKDPAIWFKLKADTIGKELNIESTETKKLKSDQAGCCKDLWDKSKPK